MKEQNNTLEYRDYIGSIEVSLADNCLFGRVLGIQGSISYEGNTLDKLKSDFKQAIDDYLYDCEQEGTEPQKPFKGSLNVRLKPENHQRAVIVAQHRKISLNKFIDQAVEHELER